jgi:hypothetical protein
MYAIILFRKKYFTLQTRKLNMQRIVIISNILIIIFILSKVIILK